ncbi:slr1658 superfamily regulator [Neosynechococcus sphagnicola]|uniref:slr1658 superfamily regulator n=1 Tax=Neosynechococcus sphagnicola TaxID=1501145 RepID=UPI000A80A6CB|nr:hypothetical protein [Neosynechococcus sphagnicola]
MSYVANELIENAVKYSDISAKMPISITLYLYAEAIIFQVINYANPLNVEKYQQFIQDFLSSDADEFYARQLENAALGTGASNIGIITMINDYSAKFGWRFQPMAANPEVVRVSVMAYLEA